MTKPTRSLLTLVSCCLDLSTDDTYTHERNARPVWTMVKFHCMETGVYDSKNVKIRTSLKPLSRDRHSTIGLVKESQKAGSRLSKSSSLRTDAL